MAVNTDDDYHLDEHEDLYEMQHSAMNLVIKDFEDQRFPFEDPAFAERVYAAIKDPQEESTYNFHAGTSIARSTSLQ